MRRHKYPSEAQLRMIQATAGNQAAAVAEAGGTLIAVAIPKLRGVGRGCGSPTPALGTSSFVPCGAWSTDLRGNRSEHLCYYCEQELKL